MIPALQLCLADARYLVKTLEPAWDLEGRLLNGQGAGQNRFVQLSDTDLLFLMEGLERLLSPKMSQSQARQPARLLQVISKMHFEGSRAPGQRIYRLPYDHECEGIGWEPCPPLFDETHSCFTQGGTGPVVLPDLRSCFLRGDRVQKALRHLLRVQAREGTSRAQQQEKYEQIRAFSRERLLDISLRQGLNELEPRLVEQGWEEGRISHSPLGRFYLAMRMHFAFRIVKLGNPGLALKHLNEIRAWDVQDYYSIDRHVAALELAGEAFRAYRDSLQTMEDEDPFWDLLRFLHSLQVKPDPGRARLLCALCAKNPYMLEELCREEPTASALLETPLAPDFVPAPPSGSRLEARCAVQILRMAGAEGFAVLIRGLKEVFGHKGANRCRIPESLKILSPDLSEDLIEEFSGPVSPSREAGITFTLRWLHERVERSGWDSTALSRWQARYLVRGAVIAAFELRPPELRDGVIEACLLLTGESAYAELFIPLLEARSSHEVCALGTGYLHTMRESVEDRLPLALGQDPGVRLQACAELENHIAFEILHAQDLWSCNRSEEAIALLESALCWLGVEHEILVDLLLVRSMGQMDLARVRRILDELRAPDDLLAELLRFLLAALAGREEECRDIRLALDVMNPHLQPYLDGEQWANHAREDPEHGSPEEAETAALHLEMCWTIEVVAALAQADIPEDLRIWPAPLSRLSSTPTSSPALSPLRGKLRSPSPGPTHAPRPKVGRNAPCPCGSGKKYKKCCG